MSTCACCQPLQAQDPSCLTFICCLDQTSQFLIQFCPSTLFSSIFHPHIRNSSLHFHDAAFFVIIIKSKVKTFWEGYKIWKNLPLVWRYCVNVKTSGRFFSNFVAFSENLNFTKLAFLKKKLDLKAGLSEDKCCLKTSLDKLNTTIWWDSLFIFLQLLWYDFF